MKITRVQVKPYLGTDPKKTTYKRMRVHFFAHGEATVPGLKKLLPEVLAKAGVHPEAIKVCVQQSRWSQKAGCSCGCSPGFVVNNLAGREVFVDATA